MDESPRSIEQLIAESSLGNESVREEKSNDLGTSEESLNVPSEEVDDSVAVIEDMQKQWEERMKMVDVLMPSPQDRYKKVWGRLQNKESITVWDMACFVVEALGSMSAVLPGFEEELKSLNRKLYTVHYTNYEDLMKWDKRRS